MMDEHSSYNEDPPIPNDHYDKKGSFFKRIWVQKRVHNEVFFPGQHVPHLPWKSFQWEENDIPADKELKDFQNVSITVKSLSHVTHNKEFDQICAIDPDAYTLLPSKKRGKSGYNTTDGSPLGDSFVGDKDQSPDEEALYHYVGPDESILPGHYIWWSVEVEVNPFEIPCSYRVSNALSKGSPYGNKKIYGSIEHALEAYQSSLRDPSNGELPRIEFRIGGTLRYRLEVCHVVIVCRENEEQLPLDKYPLWEEGRDKISYGDTGEVKFDDDHPIDLKITIANGIKCNSQNWKFYSWDQTIFGFHFPENIQTLKCPKEKEGKPCFKDTDVDQHDTKRSKCIRKRRADGEWLCPNKIKNEKITRKRSGQPLEEEPLLKK